MALSVVGALILGVLAGELVNALADRIVGVDEPIWSASQCRKCLTPLPPPAPLALRELARRRICGACGQRTSLRRPLTQLALTLLAPGLLWRAYSTPAPGNLPAWALFGMALAATVALTFIFVVDLEHRLIYDISIFPLLVALLALTAIFDRKHLLTLVFAGVFCGLLFLMFYGLGWLLYRQEALGFGDVKLALLVGVAVGWPGLITALFVTMVSSAIISLLLLASGSAERRTFIPFGVFMAGAAVFALLSAPLPW
ncbi:MAG TPA: A24 family peptidase [Ktedonobacterales bacterium]|jgi:prepilin signal peptidase PulO-like enzyme (type II secretory pathway)|nr:A24 family peptidase [Ktedonobacterales bacterium]